MIHKFNLKPNSGPSTALHCCWIILSSNERPIGQLIGSLLAAITGPWQLQSGRRGASASLAAQQRAGLYYIHQHGGSGDGANISVAYINNFRIFISNNNTDLTYFMMWVFP